MAPDETARMSCTKWTHFRCQNVAKLDRKAWSETALSFHCISCRSAKDNKFDYAKGLQRLSADALVSIEQLKVGVRRELLFMKNVRLDTSIQTDLSQNEQDPVSNAILKEYFSINKVALHSTGDGNCLFNAVSTLLAGNESRSTELRYRCCLEMVVNRDKMLRHRQAKSLAPICPDISMACLDCTRLGKWSSMWNIMALSNLLNMKIEVVYPAVNGSDNYSFKTMNTAFRPPFVDPDQLTLTVMWTSVNAPAKKRFIKQKPNSWVPNHFVPLVKTTQKVKMVELEESVCQSPDAAPTATSPVIQTNKRTLYSDVLRQSPTNTTVNKCTDAKRTKYTGAKEKKDRKLHSETVGKGGLRASPGVQHTDRFSNVTDIPSTPTPLSPTIIEQRTPVSSPSAPSSPTKPKIHVMKKKPHPVADPKTCTTAPSPSSPTPQSPVMSEPMSPASHPSAPCTPTSPPSPNSTESVGKGSLCASPGAQHTDCFASHFFPDLSTIEEESTASPLTIIEQRTPVSSPSPSSHIPQSPVMSEPISPASHPSAPCTPTSPPSPNNISVEEESEINFTRGPLKKFMELNTTLQLLQGPMSPLEQVPLGRKDGMYYIIKNTSNLEKRKHGKRSEFWDDCGAWVKGATPCSYYINRNNKLITVVKRQDVYCTTKDVKGKRDFVPMDPQPSDDEVMTVRRLYQSLKEKTENGEPFRKRVTWVENPFNREISTDTAIVEYIGDFPGKSYHGLVKDTVNNEKYTRTKTTVRENLKQKVQHRSVKEVEREMNEITSDDFEKQRNEGQLRRLKHEVNKSEKIQKAKQNIADQIICVEEMAKEHEFVQSVKHMHGQQHPVITLFTDQQITDLKRFCCKEDGMVLGMDKTYNLGDFHVTPTVYKDASVIRRRTNEHPICLGPTFIHQSSTTKAYSSFLHDIADHLTDSEISNLTIGTDEELAFKCAIRRCLRDCTHVLCTRHLKENTNRYLENTVGYPKSERDKILKVIYGQDGILQKTDIDTFNYRLNELKTTISLKDSAVGEKKFMPYFENKLIPLLNEHVIRPVRQGKISPTWTNNNCESANHVLKSAIHWKAQDLPKFINTLYRIVIGDQTERCRAIRDTGNFRLGDRFRHHLTEVSHWSMMSEEARQKRTKRFLTDSGKANSNIVVSTDGTRTTQRTPSAGRKPQQVKRKRSKRSNTPNSKRRL